MSDSNALTDRRDAGDELVRLEIRFFEVGRDDLQYLLDGFTRHDLPDDLVPVGWISRQLRRIADDIDQKLEDETVSF